MSTSANIIGELNRIRSKLGAKQLSKAVIIALQSGNGDEKSLRDQCRIELAASDAEVRATEPAPVGEDKTRHLSTMSPEQHDAYDLACHRLHRARACECIINAVWPKGEETEEQWLSAAAEELAVGEGGTKAGCTNLSAAKRVELKGGEAPAKMAEISPEVAK